MLPNFLIVGGAKCGTDALYSYLAQHPQIYMSPIKEPMFFAVEGQENIAYVGPGDREALQRWGEWVPRLDQYEALFAAVSTESAVGEASTWYLYNESAHQRIHHYIPQVKLIALLRNPVDRAYSAFNMLLRDGRETTPDFCKALAAEEERIRAKWEPMWHYCRMGFYYTQLKRYYDTFDASQIRVVLYDDFNSRPAEVVRDLFTFLEVDDRFEPDVSARHNVSLVPTNPTVHRFVAGQHPLKSVVKSVLPPEFRQRVKARLLEPNLVRPAPLPPEVRRQLVDVFRPDISQLQDLLEKDLSCWLR